MAEVAKSGVPSLSTALPCAGHQVGSNLRAGENLAAGDACYIKGSDGLVYRSTGAAANEAANVDGFAAVATKTNEAVTLLSHVDFNYGAALAPQAKYYLSGTVAGGLADAASTGGTVVIAKAIDATRVRVRASW
jgi:hypothetical protein